MRNCKELSPVELMALNALSWLAIMATARIVFILAYVPLSTLSGNIENVPLLVFNALRFDLQIVAYAMLVPLVAWIVLESLALKNRHWFATMIRLWSTLVATLLAFLAFIDHGFYSNFGNHIDQTALDFFDEGPWSLIVGIWQDYPVVWMTLALISVTTLWIVAGRHLCLQAICCRKPLWRRLVNIVLIAALQVVLMRGSLGPYPLQSEDLIVSGDSRFNDIVPNAEYMLKKAISERGKSTAPLSFDAALAVYGFSNIAEAADVFAEGLGIEIGDDSRTLLENGDTLAFMHNLLFRKSEADSLQRPNVVLVLSESWGAYLTSIDSKEVPLCNAMTRHMREDLTVDTFTSVRNGTECSLATVTVAAPFKSFFLSKLAHRHFDTSIATIFKRAGYSTAFVSGMNSGWSNLASVMPRLDFDEVATKYEMLKKRPEYEGGDIGLWDHHTFNTMKEMLDLRTATKDKRPKFLMCLTTTNHPPLQLPEGISLPELPDSFLTSKRFDVDYDVLLRYLRAFQYSSQCIADFIDAVKRSELGDNTIIMITGDHNVRHILNYDVVGEEWRYRVPLYLYLPPSLRNGIDKLASHGCHYDILPTLAHLALGGVQTLSIGHDLTDTADKPSRSAWNEGGALCHNADKEHAERFAAAREALLHIYFSLLAQQQ